MIPMVLLWSSVAVWADQGDDQRDVGNLIVGLDGLRGPWAARVLLILWERYFMSQGTMNNEAIQSGSADETSTTRDLLRRQVPRATNYCFG
jgi:hypothetical protein